MKWDYRAVSSNTVKLRVENLAQNTLGHLLLDVTLPSNVKIKVNFGQLSTKEQHIIWMEQRIFMQYKNNPIEGSS